MGCAWRSRYGEGDRLIASEPVIVQLIDGRLVESSAEEWRTETLARHILRKPLPERQAWLADHEAKHGKADTQVLKDAMTAIFEARKA